MPQLPTEQLRFIRRQRNCSSSRLSKFGIKDRLRITPSLFLFVTGAVFYCHKVSVKELRISMGGMRGCLSA